MRGAPSTVSHSPVVRGARADELERILDVHVSSFPDPRPVEVRRRVFVQNRLGGFEHLRVVEVAGEVVAHAFAFPIGLWAGGVLVRGVAIASVGVAVEARGRGFGTALLRGIHAEARARGDHVALLYPFREGYYRRLGYAPVAARRVARLSPRSLPDEWRRLPGDVRRAGAADLDAMRRVYRSVAERGTGFVDRTPGMWEHDLLEERDHFIVLDGDGGGVRGYAVVRLVQSDARAPVVGEVREVLGEDDLARRRMFGALAALGDQVAELTVAFAHDDPLEWALIDADRRAPPGEVDHPQGVVSRGPMIHLLDAEAALLARGYPAGAGGSAAVELSIDDARPFTLAVSAGRATRGPASGADRVLRIRGDVLASVAFGGLSMTDAARLGWMGPCSPAALQAASAIMSLPAFFSLDPF